jgi:hypothetical protein
MRKVAWQPPFLSLFFLKRPLRSVAVRFPVAILEGPANQLDLLGSSRTA